MRSFIGLQGGGSIFKLCLRKPRVFFSRVSFPLDEVFVISRGTWVFQDLFNFIFFFSIEKVRWWCREIHPVGFIFMIRR